MKKNNFTNSNNNSKENISLYADLQGKHVLITGGASGIGAELVRAYVNNHCRVSFLDIDTVSGKELVQELEQFLMQYPNIKGSVKFYSCNLTNISQLKKTLTKVLAEGIVDIIINNAANDTRHETEKLSSKFWDELVAVNLKSYFFVIQSLVTPMKKQRRGVILNLSSNAGILGLLGYPAYVSAKAGIMGLTRALARELGEFNIRVNAILPGWVMTPKQKSLWADKRSVRDCLKEQSIKTLINPDDISGSALFLSSTGARMITGQMLVVDGGRVFY